MRTYVSKTMAKLLTDPSRILKIIHTTGIFKKWSLEAVCYCYSSCNVVFRFWLKIQNGARVQEGGL